jgi:tetratricopeptide (TPR) repeat protein
MHIKPINHPLLSRGHLTDEGVALWATALLEGRDQDLPQALLLHVDGCMQCKKKILELYDDLKAIQDLTVNKSAKQCRENNKTFRIRKISNLNKAAALLITIATVGSILYFTFHPDTSHEQIFSEYFIPYPNMITIKSVNEYNMQAAMYYYDIKSYDSAILLFDKILLEEPGMKSIMFYKANSLLAAGMTEKAIPILEAITQDSSEYQSPATWYLALALLKSGETNKAKKLFLDLTGQETYYCNRAKIILDQLK